MKKILAAIAILLFLNSNAHASLADDACVQLLCALGYMEHGVKDVPCDPALDALNKMVKKSRLGKLRCHATKELRFAQLVTCNQTDYSPEDIWDKLITCDDYD